MPSSPGISRSVTRMSAPSRAEHGEGPRCRRRRTRLRIPIDISSRVSVSRWDSTSSAISTRRRDSGAGGGGAIAHRDRIAGRCTRRRLCRRRGGLVLQREQIRYRDIAGFHVQISTPVAPRCQHVRENDLDLLAIETEPFEPRCKSFGR
jgi:hypothetical protein